MKRLLLFGILMMSFGTDLCFGAWVKQTSGTTRNLYDVWFKCPPSGRGWAVGDSGTIVSTVNWGTTWVSQTSNTNERLWGVAWDLKYVGAKEWATAVGGDQYPGVAVHTTSGGTTWTLINLPHCAPQAISYGDSVHGWAVGMTRSVWMTSDGGRNWAIQDSGGWRSHWFGVWFVNNRVGWACGEHYNISKTTDGGASWVPHQAAGSDRIDSWHGISFRDSLLGCAVGDFGQILRTTNGGANWDPVSTGYPEYLYGVFLSSYGSLGYAVGANGRILATSNGGASWVAQASGVTHTLRGVWCWLDLPGIWAFAVGDSGTILYQFIPTGVEESSAGTRDQQRAMRLRILQNPTTAKQGVRLWAIGNGPNARLQIFDVAGRLVRSFALNSLPSAQCSIALPAGVYFVRLDGSGASLTRKVVVVD